MSRKFTPSSRHSIASPTIYRGVDDEPKKDRRGKTNARGEQGKGTCRSCEAEVTLRKVSRGSPSRFGDLPNGTPVAGQHRVGGGTYSARRGDALCPGAGQIPRIKPTGTDA